MKRYFGQKGRIFLLCTLSAMALAPAALAQNASLKSEHAKEIGASERVNFSGKLRMLSQRVVATGCNYAAGIDTDKSGAAMMAAKDEFELIVDALEFGNPDLGIVGEEKRKKTVRRIGMLRDEWTPVAASLAEVEPGTSQETMTELATGSAPLLEAAKALVVDMSAQYSDPSALLQSHSILIDISGRQRMLTQRMSKNVCLVSSGVTADIARDELAKTAEMFETSLFALVSGMPAAGIAPPPNETIAASLNVVVDNWSQLKPHVEAVLAGQTLSDAERAFVFHGMNQMTGNMNTAVGQYSDASKMGS